MPPYLRPTAPIAADVLLPADPGLAMSLAQRLVVKPLMANHNHGLWGYTGATPDGLELTIQATGVGGPSAAAVLGELVGHGARRLIRVGRCAAIDRGLTAGEAAVVEGALGADGVSRALGATRSAPDPDLTSALRESVDGPSILVASADLPASAGESGLRAEWAAAGMRAFDLESSALFALGRRLGVAIAAAVVIAEVPGADPTEERLEQELLTLGDHCAGALSKRREATRRQAAGRAGS